jgi:hypothetical protein
MPDVNLPLSGAVTQSIDPWVSWFSAFGSQIGLINVNLGTSADPEVERNVISKVASYGRQLGRIEEALVVLLKHFHPQVELSAAEERAIRALQRMVEEVEDVKRARRNGRPAG